MLHRLSAPALTGLALAVGTLASFPLQAVAQQEEPIPTPFTVAGEILIAQPVGEFADYVGTGVGLGLHGLIDLDPAGIIALRLDAGFVNYGNETRRVCFSETVGCFIELDLTTSNNIAIGGIGPQLELPAGPLRPFVHAGIGFAYFATQSSIRGSDGNQETIAQTTNFDDLTFAWTAGGGLRIPFRIAGQRLGVTLAARYHGKRRGRVPPRGRHREAAGRRDHVHAHPQRGQPGHVRDRHLLAGGHPTLNENGGAAGPATPPSPPTPKLASRSAERQLAPTRMPIETGNVMVFSNARSCSSLSGPKIAVSAESTDARTALTPTQNADVCEKA